MGKSAESIPKKGKNQKVANRKHLTCEAAGAANKVPSIGILSSLKTVAPQLTEMQLFPNFKGDVVFPDMTEQERAVEAAKATIPGAVSREVLRKDPIYRIMHALPRSDVLEVVRSRFAAPHCARAAAYFDLSYMNNPLRRLRLQIGCDGPTGLYLFFSRIAAHRHTLRVLDLSRNRLCADDVVLLCNLLGFGAEGTATASLVRKDTGESDNDSAVSVKSKGDVPECSATTVSALSSSSPAFSSVAPSPGSCLELLDLSYNTKIGNDGAVHLLRAMRRCPSIRAVMLKSVGVDDAGALAVSDVARHWPTPVSTASSSELNGFLPSSVLLRPSTASATKFYLNLNENYIGAHGTYVLGKGMPDYVSLTLAKQRFLISKDRKRFREATGDRE